VRWHIAVPGAFGGGSQTDLLLYDRHLGVGKFLKSVGGGDFATLAVHEKWLRGWDVILPLNLGGGQATDLFFYRRRDGAAKLYTTDGAGGVTLLKSLNLQAGWDVVVQGAFGGSVHTDLLFYRRSDGLAKFVTVDQNGTLAAIGQDTWDTTWDAIVPGQFAGGGTTDLLLYASLLNRALSLGWRGCVDTDLSFGEFFSGDHTVAARIMLQFPSAYAGPACAENGSGSYFLGQGYARAKGADPRLRLQVGSKVKNVSLGAVKPGEWHHIAAVRAGNTFKLLLDGVSKGTLNVDPGDPELPTPSAKLRLGRRTDGSGAISDGVVKGSDGIDGERETQFFGLIDEVVVFAKALKDNEVAELANAPGGRLQGKEPALKAAWTFDASTPAGEPLPAALRHGYTLVSPDGAGGIAANVIVLSPSGDASYDSKLLPRPSLRAPIRFPFDQGDHWRVVQGNSGINGTHVGYATFALDLQSAPFPGTGDEALHAVAKGTVAQVVDDDAEGSNFIIVEHANATDEYSLYLHLKPGSAQVDVGDSVAAGQEIAHIGPVKRHVHFSIRNRPNPAPGGEDAVSIPSLFGSFDACTPADPTAPSCTTWKHLKGAVPANDQWVQW
jgi:murein DD-endopeptidase MepM/ murein hydrolase activator NlpD